MPPFNPQGERTIMNIERRKLQDLKDAGYNPRIDLKPGDPEFENIKRSIEEFGYIQPIIVNGDGVILSGHQRRKVLLYLGHAEAEVVVAQGMTEDQEKALVVAMNKVSGKWDEEALYEILRDFDRDLLEMTGFTEIEFEKLEIKFDTDASGDLVHDQSQPEKNVVIQYNIVFDDEEQQRVWHEFVRKLREEYPDEETIAARVVAFIKDAG